MKKRLSLLLVLCLLLSAVPFASLAEVREIDFGDFTMTLDPSTPGKINDKVSGQPVTTLYPAYLAEGDQKTNMSITWFDNDTAWGSFTDDDIVAYAQQVMDQTLKQGAATTTFLENSLVNYRTVEVDGAKGVLFTRHSVYRQNTDPENTVRENYNQSYSLETEFGTYFITIVTDSMEKIAKYVDPLVASIRWKRAASAAGNDSGLSITSEPTEFQFADYSITVPGNMAVMDLKGDGSDVTILNLGSQAGGLTIEQTERGLDFEEAYKTQEGMQLIIAQLHKVEKEYQDNSVKNGWKYTGGTMDCPVVILMGKYLGIGGDISWDFEAKDGQRTTIYQRIVYVDLPSCTYVFIYRTNNQNELEEISQPMLESVHWL